MTSPYRTHSHSLTSPEYFVRVIRYGLLLFYLIFTGTVVFLVSPDRVVGESEKKVNTRKELAQTQNTTIRDSCGEISKGLLEKRIVIISQSINDDLAKTVITQLLYLDSQKPGKDIYLYINSPGGSVYSGMAIYDTMKSLKSDVVTVSTGLSASMGAFLLSGGTKGKRFSLPNSRIMIHQPLGGAQGQAIDIEIQAREILYFKAQLNQLLAKHTGQPLEKIANDTERDFFMSAQEAKAYGMIDKVINKLPL